jgi:uncharacterized protein
MTQAAKAQEPSMEEILASIRRIIADDDATKTPQRAPEPPKAAPRPAAPPPPAPVEPEVEEPEPVAASADVESEAADILDLTESMATPAFEPLPPAANPAPGTPPQFRNIEAPSDVGFDESEPKPVPPPNEAPSLYLGSEPGLVSRETSAAVDSAFNAFAQTVLVQNARTLEDLVREMLRPMLKSWLDDNLPGMVERLVRAEIERVARGR